jgi:hypothetical protein
MPGAWGNAADLQFESTSASSQCLVQRGTADPLEHSASSQCLVQRGNAADR